MKRYTMTPLGCYPLQSPAPQKVLSWKWQLHDAVTFSSCFLHHSVKVMTTFCVEGIFFTLVRLLFRCTASMALRRMVLIFAAWLRSLGWLTLTQFHWFETSSSGRLFAAAGQSSHGIFCQVPTTNQLTWGLCSHCCIDRKVECGIIKTCEQVPIRESEAFSSEIVERVICWLQLAANKPPAPGGCASALH
jgi:hypothetical protein